MSQMLEALRHIAREPTNEEWTGHLREQFPPLAPQEPEPETPPAWLGAAFVAMAVFAVIGAAFVGVQIGRAVMIYLTGGAP